MSPGIRSGVNCTRLKSRPSSWPQRLDEGRLADAGDALEQHVAAAEDAGEDQAVQFGPAEQHAVELLEQPAGEVGGPLEVVGLKDRFAHVVRGVSAAQRRSKNRFTAPRCLGRTV